MAHASLGVGTRRAVAQATRFGIELLSPQEVTGIELEGPYKRIQLSDGNSVTSRAVIITTGVAYRRLPAPGVDDFTGAGVYYGAATTEANACMDKEIYVIGGGNSAGQGAVYLSNFAKTVHILIRRPDLSSSMSSYLIDQIDGIENIQVHGRRQVVGAAGDKYLQTITIENMDDQSVTTVSAGALFVFIGARPHTDWLKGQLIRDERGFIQTGKEIEQHDTFGKVWKQDRMPFLLETCVPGIFAAGDVRAGAMNRVASAVGEGAMAIKFVHEYLAEN